MIGLILFSFIFIHSNLGQRCTTDIFIDSMFTFRHYDPKKLMAVKMITYGDNSSISCLITNQTKDEFKISLKKHFEWFFRPLFQVESKDKKVKIRKKIDLTKTNKTIYATGSCNELQMYRFGPDAVGIYSCKPKDGLFSRKYDKHVQVEIFVDGELIGPDTGCPENLTLIPTSNKNLMPPNFLNHFKAKQNRSLHIKRHEGVESTQFYVPSLEQDCTPCFSLKDPIDKTGILVERNSCVQGYFVIRTEHFGTNTLEKRYFTSFHSCEILRDEVYYSNRPTCLNESICVPELCSLPIDVKPIDLSKNFSVNFKVKKSKKFEIDPNALNIASYIEEPEGYNIEMQCPMINATDPKEKGRVRWYKCNQVCIKITKSQRQFIRYHMKQSDKTIRIYKLQANDTAKFACVRHKIILGALSLVVTPPLGYFDVRSPIGSMFASTFFVYFVYTVFCIFRISGKNIAAKMKNKTQNKGDHKRIKYKKLPKNS
ncbi:uncharacterized protein LOC107367551 [Tetranychus urticae]|uniref:uncharacterized protein LOC107367551 n=1 Tax=Tetranychus urticae TaxID=32264 RepID=UPI00077B9274|nr:uncharacterized protein LOC107367551 [Tetranychus urticae]